MADELNDVTKDMLLIRSLDPDAHVALDYQNKWYVVANIMLGDTTLASYTGGVGNRADNPESAVRRYVLRLKSHKPTEYWHVTYAGNERDYQWNGVAFAEQPFLNA